ncbi:hypothetical protein OJAV_G00140960 [Oryzias javanicus]|uniref:Ig-like domain-containing protein n=1 Tax=Oryzias javanicus TaxID=123683 RepID=A0A437CMU4_ORYJA|nr:hypothetical protein OJAV_G00140960 [Oryzias javanicus]
MPGAAFGVFFLQLLASVIQGLQNVNVIPGSTVETVMGQNVSLPCILKEDHNLKITIIEWTKNGATKLAVYSADHGLYLFLPNVTVQIKRSITNKTLGTYLYLQNVKKWDSGNYTCTISSFPTGSDLRVTSIIVKDEIQIICDANATVEVLYGGNVTIGCTAIPHAQYRWTKDQKLVSDREFLDLRLVTDDHAGIYILTVYAGDKSLHREFSIIVQSETIFTTDVVTVAPENLTERIHSSFPPPSTTELSAPVNWTSRPDSSDAPLTDSLATDISETTEEETTHSISFTSAMTPDNYSETSHPFNFTSTNADTALIRSTLDSTTDQMTEEPKSHKVHLTTVNSVVLEESSTLTSSTKKVNLDHTQNVNSPGGKGTTQSHLVLIILPVLTVLGLFGFIYWVQKIYKRHLEMEGPPSFKPPPPPVKYTATRQNETPTHFFPTSRCNSIADYPDDNTCV